MKKEKIICGWCRPQGTYPCPGHIATAASSGGGTDDPKPKAEGAPLTPSIKAIAETSSPLGNTTAKDTVSDWSQVLKPQVGTTTFEVGLISIKSDNLHGVLTVGGIPGLSIEDKECVKVLLNAIKLEFTTFKRELEKRGISTERFSAEDTKDDELTIKIPHPYYSNFIKQLASRNFIPSPYTARLNRNEMEDHVSEKRKSSILSK